MDMAATARMTRLNNFFSLEEDMTRSELTALLAQRFPQLLKADADMAVGEILGAIGQTLSQGHRVEIQRWPRAVGQKFGFLK